MQFNLGRILPIFRGQYVNTATYYPLDIVYFNGSSYVCKQTARNVLPTNTVYWQIVATKGELSPTLTPEQTQSIIQQIESDTNWVSDSNYVHTDNNFTNTDKTAIENIGDGTIQIMVNNVSVGTFSTNTKDNHSINITVPTNINQLSGGGEFYRSPTILEFEDADLELNVDKNTVYKFNQPINKLTILGGYWGDDIKESYSQSSWIIFTTTSDFVYEDNDKLRYADNLPQFNPNTEYRIEIIGGVARIEQII